VKTTQKKEREREKNQLTTSLTIASFAFQKKTWFQIILIITNDQPK
jgi:hypothetical protein